MPTPQQDPTPALDPVDALIAAYVQAIEQGQVPDRRALLDQNPDQAEALQAFFSDFDRMDRVAAPLRIANESDETAALDGLGTAHPPRLRYFGDYALLEEIARGGMGIVYKARQTSLNRPVALKMILAGTFATPREVARFQAEAEAAANLDHPHIVPVYEVGEHEGQQYFSMKFIEGGSLANRPRAKPRPEVLGLITIARAVHHAHQHGVLHRDLKPANVLVDGKGELHVTDFGLAKRLTDLDRSMTEAGQILGTPRYMSPEQAAGRKDLTVAADVYALGVILYERLTGRTPFQGETALALLRQVRESDPPRPSLLCHGLDRDLETVTLKCLEKDPACRYATAEELVDDLSRWLDGRPINARPVGQAERLVRWCRRNPTVASLAASVALALVLGILVSTGFALEQQKARVRAEKAEDATERAFARSLVRPLDLGGVGKIVLSDFEPPQLVQPGLSEPEVEALWELATQGSETLRDRFLDQSICEPFALRQFSARSEPALIAAIGLDGERQTRAASLLVERFRRTDLLPEERIELAFLILQVGDGSDSRGEEASQVLMRALDDPPTSFGADFALKVLGLRDSLPPTRAAALLVAASGRVQDHFVRLALYRSLAALSSRLEPFEAAAYCGRASQSIAEGIENETNLSAIDQSAEALALLTGRLEPAEASAICFRATRSITRVLLKSDRVDRKSNSLGRAGTILSERLDPVGAVTIARPLIEAMKHDPYDYHLLDLLVSLSRRLDPAQASAICGQAAGILVEVIEQKKDVTWDWAKALVALSGRLAPAEASVLCDRAARVIAETLMPNQFGGDRSAAGSALALLSTRLGPVEAVPLARSIARAMETEQDGDKLDALSNALASLSTHLMPVEAARLAGPAAKAITESIERESRADTVLIQAMTRLSAVLAPADAATLGGRVARIAVESIERDKMFVTTLSSQLESLSARLLPSESAILCGRAARVFTEGFEVKKNVYGVLEANSLASLSARTSPSEGMALCGRAARSIARVMERQEIESNPYDLPGSLASLSVMLDPDEAASISRSLVVAIERTKERYARDYLAVALEALSARLDTVEAARIARSVAGAIGRATEAEARSRFAHALARLSVRLDSLEMTKEVANLVCSRSMDGTLAEPLRTLLSSPTFSRREQRASQFMATLLQFGPCGTLTAIIREASEPDPCRLTDQELVELLKMPTCIGATRRVVLDQLGNIHGRRFFNHWEFVRFARDKGLKLDLTSPPRRPDSKASMERWLDEPATAR